MKKDPVRSKRFLEYAVSDMVDIYARNRNTYPNMENYGCSIPTRRLASNISISISLSTAYLDVAKNLPSGENWGAHQGRALMSRQRPTCMCLTNAAWAAMS
jgi:hypothetical protein